jgi:small subunit ribosomal protein S5|tara:strand:+ start:5163 stop:5711 length:549 start_codon:yes stop_codon:yes gene_type:complete
MAEEVKQKEKVVSKAGTQTDRRPQQRRHRRRVSRRGERVRSEFDQKVIGIRRVTRVVAGGRRFSFSVAVVIGNRKGSVGVGVGKASDTALAIEKATRDAKKNMLIVKLSDDARLPYEVSAKYAASRVSIIPAPGKGLVAGSSVRTVLELAGVKDVTAKIFSRSKNRINNARAAIEALKQFSE